MRLLPIYVCYCSDIVCRSTSCPTSCFEYSFTLEPTAFTLRHFPLELGFHQNAAGFHRGSFYRDLVFQVDTGSSARFASISRCTLFVFATSRWQHLRFSSTQLAARVDLFWTLFTLSQLDDSSLQPTCSVNVLFRTLRTCVLDTARPRNANELKHFERNLT